MPQITLDHEPASTAVNQGHVFYTGEIGDRPVIVSAAVDDMLQAFPEVRDQHDGWAVKMRHTAEMHANRVLDEGRQPMAVVDEAGQAPGLRLALTLDDLMPPKHKAHTL